MDNFKVRDKRNKGWFYLDNEYLNGYAKIFGAIGTAIYVSLCRHADGQQKCFPSYKKICEELNISEKTVKKYIRIFKDWNLIYVEQDKDNGGKFKNNTYWLIDKDEWKKPMGNELPTDNRRVIVSTTVGQQFPETVGQQIPHKDTNKKDTNIKNTHIATQSVAGKEINNLIELFKEVNPSYEQLFKNKSQRVAIERMVKKFGREKVENAIKKLPNIINKKYAPRITSPIQLENKLGELIAFVNQERSGGNKKLTIIQ